MFNFFPLDNKVERNIMFVQKIKKSLYYIYEKTCVVLVVVYKLCFVRKIGAKNYNNRNLSYLTGHWTIDIGPGQ